jgi:hypothetical protein
MAATCSESWLDARILAGDKEGRKVKRLRPGPATRPRRASTLKAFHSQSPGLTGAAGYPGIDRTNEPQPCWVPPAAKCKPARLQNPGSPGFIHPA